MDPIKELIDNAEDRVHQISAPLKPYLPVIARILLVITFYEDSLRIILQWYEQNQYLTRYRHFLPYTSEPFLVLIVASMVICSTLAVRKQYTEQAVAGLIAVIILQYLAYGMIFNLKFILYNVSIIGGLFMLVAEKMLSERKKIFAGLPNFTQNDKSTYIQLAGRILLVLIFISFVFAGEMTITRAIVSVFGLVACVMVAVGFRAKSSALFLVLLLSIMNVFINNWWTLQPHHFERDHIKFDFFQTLSTVGGFLLLASVGPGGISVDEKKKAY